MQKKISSDAIDPHVFDRLHPAIPETKDNAVVPSRPLENSHEDVKRETPAVLPEFEAISENSASELYFERENTIPDFERETVYDIDSFEKKSTHTEKLLAPPPDFQESLKTLSPDLQKNFKAILNGDIVGMWPIKQTFLLK